MNTEAQARTSGYVIFAKGTLDERRVEFADLTSVEMQKWLAHPRLDESVRASFVSELALRKMRADKEFREDVIAELVAEGKARHVADNLTNTEAKMLAEARRLGEFLEAQKLTHLYHEYLKHKEATPS